MNAIEKPVLSPGRKELWGSDAAAFMLRTLHVPSAIEKALELGARCRGSVIDARVVRVLGMRGGPERPRGPRSSRRRSPVEDTSGAK